MGEHLLDGAWEIWGRYTGDAGGDMGEHLLDGAELLALEAARRRDVQHAQLDLVRARVRVRVRVRARARVIVRVRVRVRVRSCSA